MTDNDNAHSTHSCEEPTDLILKGIMTKTFRRYVLAAVLGTYRPDTQRDYDVFVVVVDDDQALL